jgi:SAM-dependent methyltransferase
MDISWKEDPFAYLEDNLFDDRKSEGTPRVVRRNWGIPTFEDQIDRGIRTFLLSNLHHPFQSITLYLEHRKNSTGSDLWDSALVLAHNLQYLVGSLKGKTVLELGSGTGAVGLYCSKCLEADHVTLTDLPDNLALLVQNRDVNSISEECVSIVALDWESEHMPNEFELGFDLIIGSDLCKCYRFLCS